MSSLVEFAKDEFKIMGWDKTKDEMQLEVCNNLIELLSVLAKQGHSGFSIGYVLNLFNKLANFTNQHRKASPFRERIQGALPVKFKQIQLRERHKSNK